MSGRRRGRATAVEITLYKSVGVAVQDLAAAALVLAAAREVPGGETMTDTMCACPLVTNPLVRKRGW